MKNYKITVNGNIYDVTVEETGSNAASATPVVSVPKAAPASAATPVSAGTQGSVKISAPMPGKVLSVKVSAGEKVTKGQIIMILEAMKMENEIVASQDGTVASINVNEGASVEAGAVLATLN